MITQQDMLQAANIKLVNNSLTGTLPESWANLPQVGTSGNDIWYYITVLYANGISEAIPLEIASRVAPLNSSLCEDMSWHHQSLPCKSSVCCCMSLVREFAVALAADRSAAVEQQPEWYFALRLAKVDPGKHK